ncbi:MAG: flagellar biosynthesis protein FlhF [Phycisphaerales bacterium]
MNLKTYRARSMADALAEVKKDLGKDAVILHTRTYKVGSVMGLGGKTVVEITASDQASARLARTQRANAPSTAAAAGTAANRAAYANARTSAAASLSGATAIADRETPSDEFTPSSFASFQTRRAAAPPTPLTHERAEASPTVRAGAHEQFVAARAPITRAEPSPTPERAPHSQVPPTPSITAQSPARRDAIAMLSTRIAPAPDANYSALQDELLSIKRLVGQVLHATRQTAVHVATTPNLSPLGALSDPLMASYMRLQESGVPADLVESIIGGVRDELTSAELDDDGVVRQSVLRRLAALIPVVGQTTKGGMQRDGRPLTIAMLGPTGVGKTTTIAKLAATYKLRHAQRVGLLTCDTYRIAAVEQLRTYANIIGLPLRVVNSPAEMAQALDAMTDCDVILIDTMGRSQHDSGKLTELARLVDAARPHETHLVLSLASAEPVILRTIEQFSRLLPTRVLFTKLDEAVNLGVVVSSMRATRLPVGYVTTGQEVPDQIEIAAPDRLARHVLDGAASTTLTIGAGGGGGTP